MLQRRTLKDITRPITDVTELHSLHNVVMEMPVVERSFQEFNNYELDDVMSAHQLDLEVSDEVEKKLITVVRFGVQSAAGEKGTISVAFDVKRIASAQWDVPLNGKSA